jgi:hypothetical protein
LVGQPVCYGAAMRLTNSVKGYVKDFDAYLQELKSCKVRSVKEMVEFNEQHMNIALPPGKYQSSESPQNAQC